MPTLRESDNYNYVVMNYAQQFKLAASFWVHCSCRCQYVVAKINCWAKLGEYDLAPKAGIIGEPSKSAQKSVKESSENASTFDETSPLLGEVEGDTRFLLKSR